MFKKSHIFYLFPIFFLAFFIFCYLSVPDSVSLSEGSRYLIELNPALNVSKKTVPASAQDAQSVKPTPDGIELNAESAGKYTLGIKMFDFIPLKNIEVNISPQYSVIPSGEPIGIKIFADGLLIINVSDVNTGAGTASPATSAGLVPGDRIISANSEMPATSEELSKIVNSAEGEILLEIMRDNEKITIPITPAVSSDDGRKKLGIWVRDSTAGVGTMTFYDPKTSTFATLGHAITDVDTGDIITPKRGTLCDCEIISVKKGTSGEPGEISGVFGEENLGDILMNSSLGVYGRLTSPEKLDDTGYIPVATRFEVKQGEAYILSDVDGCGVKKYSVMIDEVSKSEKVDNKGLVISVTDPVLLEKTGGIVQGMSGSPVIQNGKLVGAVTHVFVNDPTRGYGIFIENMLAEAEEIK